MKDDHVKPQKADLQNSPTVADKSNDAALMALLGHAACLWNDKQYSDGATVCDAHRRYECWNGKWLEIGMC
jgi:hypothetical protein